MDKSKKVKQMISDWIIIEATSPWDGVARFDEYEVPVHKYDNEDLFLIERSDERYTRAVDAILQQIDPTLWDRLLEDYK